MSIDQKKQRKQECAIRVYKLQQKMLDDMRAVQKLGYNPTPELAASLDHFIAEYPIAMRELDVASEEYLDPVFVPALK
jgi:hypothetical protein